MLTKVLSQILASGSQISVDSQAVTGGTIFITTISRAGQIDQVSSNFVPSALGSTRRYLSLTNAKDDTGIPLTAVAGTPTGAVGIARTAGTSLTLVGEATSSSAKTNKALFEFNLPDSYVPGKDIAVVVNAFAAGTGTLTTLSTTMTVAAYSETNGVEAALSVSAAVLIPKTTAADLAFTITGTGLVPGQHIALELTMLITTASGANTGTINSISFQA